jgi:two-component system KDP operon response regulator KdpE
MKADAIRIVLIEDDPHIRRFLRMTLEAESANVAEAASGRHGLAETASHRPDLIILDLGLPDMDGIDVIAQVRAWSAVPIIVLSARSEEAQKVAALDIGADDYLCKPFGNAELLARIRAHLRKRSASGAEMAPVVQFCQIVVDLSQRLVKRSGEIVHLTPIEYKLLAAMVRHAGKVMTHTHLLREVWGSGYAERAHYLRIYMGHLRQKLENDPVRPAHITTETGVGYRLVL